MIVSKTDLDSITQVSASQPHAVLGMHPCKAGKKNGLVMRAYLEDARSCEVVDVAKPDSARYTLERLTEDGFFEGFIPRKAVFNYRLRIERYNGEVREFYDPYGFLPGVSEEDVYLFNEGKHDGAYKMMGAHVRKLNDIAGVSFAVWAPSATRVSLVGDFNHWNGRYHPMRSLGV